MSSEATIWSLRAAPFEASHLAASGRGLRQLRDVREACLADCLLEALAPGWDLGSDLANDEPSDALADDEEALGAWQALRDALQDASACAWFERLLDASDAQGGVLPPATVRTLVEGLRRTRVLERLAERGDEAGEPTAWRELDGLLTRAAAAGAWVAWMTTG